MSGGRFNRTVLVNDPIRRATMLGILEGALDVVEPHFAVRRVLHRIGSGLEVAGVTANLDEIDRVVVIAFGKAAPAMARAAIENIDDKEVIGLVVSNHAEPLPGNLELHVTGHPLPDHRSAAAAEKVLKLLHHVGERDLVLCLISGGGSALLELPATGISMEEEQATVDALLMGGANINELNTVRKHLSAIKGGRLAEAAAPAQLFTLILSDVVGNPLDVIASGPSVPDPTTFENALAVIDRYDLRDKLPGAIVEHLEAGRRAAIAETPKVPYSRQVVTIVGDGPTAARGAASAAEKAGLSVQIATTTMTGDAREEAIRCLETAGQGVTVFAGETTVKVAGKGRGGRNQEAALAAARYLVGNESTIFATLGTDGIDGATEAAGAIVDGRTIARGTRLGLDVEACLADNDSSTYLEAVGDLLITGPTGTNVGDVWIVWRF